MGNKNKILVTLKKDIDKSKNLEDKLIVLISELYSEHILETKREDKVLLDKLQRAIKGREIVFENNLSKVFQ
jgi:hypothetical protein